MDGACSVYRGEERRIQGIPEGKKPFRVPWRGWEDNFKMGMKREEPTRCNN
jgi:hypothetical protein